MKKQIFKITFLFASILFVASCAKEEAAPEEEVPVVVNKGSFNWTLSSGQNVTADSAHCYTSITTIYAFKNGTTNSIEINLSALSVGSYSISSATGNAFSFVNGATTYDASAGTVNITANSGNKLSGNFTATLTGGAITSISGGFQDILKR